MNAFEAVMAVSRLLKRNGVALALDVLPPDRRANPRISPDGGRLLGEAGGHVIDRQLERRPGADSRVERWTLKPPPRRRLHNPRAERMKVTPPSPPSAQSVQTKKKPPGDLAISP